MSSNNPLTAVIRTPLTQGEIRITEATAKLSQIQDRLNNGTVNVTWWGSRYLSYPNTVDTIKLNAIADYLIDYIQRYSGNFSQQNCQMAQNCIEKMRRHYHDSDPKAQDTLVKRVFKFFSDLIGIILPNFGYTMARRIIENSPSNLFVLEGQLNLETILQNQIRNLQLYPPLTQLSHTHNREALNPHALHTGETLLALYPLRYKIREGISDDQIKEAFQELPLLIQGLIKRQMWVNAGGIGNPDLGDNPSTWAQQQLQGNPFPRDAFLRAVKMLMQRVQTDILRYLNSNVIDRIYDFFELQLLRPNITDAEIREYFAELPQNIQNEIKDRMWFLPNGPAEYNADQERINTWMDTQLRNDPLPRDPLSQAVRIVRGLRDPWNAVIPDNF